MADIKEVIDLMVANKEPHEDIMKIINDYNKAQKESSTKETITTPEVKEDQSQGVDVKVEENTASNGEESSTDTQGSNAEDIMAEIIAARLTKEEAEQSNLIASEILGESKVDLEEDEEQEEDLLFQEGSFFPNESLLESTVDQVDKQNNVKAETESKEKTRRKTKEEQLKEAKKKLELINKSLPKENKKEITEQNIMEEAKTTSIKKINTNKRLEKLEANVNTTIIGKGSTQKEKEEIAKIMSAEVSDNIKNNILTTKAAKKRIDAIKVESEKLKNDKAYKNSESLVKQAKTAYEEDPTKELYAVYEKAYRAYEVEGSRVNGSYAALSKEYNEQYDVYTAAWDKHAGLVEKDEDLNIFLEAYSRDNSILWGHSFGKLAVTLGDMGINALELEDKLKLPNLIKLGMSVVEDGLGYDLGSKGDALEAGITHYMEVVLPNMGLKTSTNQRIKARAWLNQARNGLAKAPTFSETKSMADFGAYISDLAFNQAPNLAMMYATGGASLYAMGAIAAGGKFGEYEDIMSETGVKFSPLQMYTAATLTGVTEALSEKITLGQIGQFKTAMSGSTTLKKGFTDYLVNQLFSVKGIAQTVSSSGQEAVSEMSARLSENLIDKYIMDQDRDLLDGVSEAGWSGFFMSTVLFKAPVVGKRLYSAIEGKDANQKIGEKQARLKQVGELLKNPNLSLELKNKYQTEHQKVVKDINSIQQDEISKLDQMSRREKKNLLDISRKKYKLRLEQDQVANSGLDVETKKAEINNIKNEISKLDNDKSKIIAPYYLQGEIKTIKEAIKKSGLDGNVTEMTSEEIYNIKE